MSVLGVLYQLLSQTDSPHSGNDNGHHSPRRLTFSATPRKELLFSQTEPSWLLLGPQAQSLIRELWYSYWPLGQQHLVPGLRGE